MSIPATHVVVGAGLAGASAAIAMREAGFAGRIVLVGDEPHPPYDRPPLSKEALTAETLAAPHLHPESRYGDLGIALRLGCRVDGIDAAAQRLRLADGSALPYDRLLLATGGHARRLAVPGGERVLTLRGLDDVSRLRAGLAGARRVAVVGAGVIGLEVAASARARGCDVIVLEAAAGAMRRVLPPDLAGFVEDLHRARGVELRFGVAITAIRPDGPGQCVVCADGEIAADLVFAGIGIERAIGLAVAAGIATDGGILVDEFGRTDRPHIFAAGDVASFWHPRLGRRLLIEHWRHALAHGTAVGRAMCDVLEPYDEIPWFWTDQYGVNIQVGGLPLAGARTVLRGSLAAGHFTAFHLADDRLVGATTVDEGGNMRAALALMRLGAPVDDEALADAALPLRRLVPRGR
ncbi:MAG TPA: FAD-dependent oxidoreductase [Stellaceae bacterium]|nr:FAD-dependent oxidoreductase [Stellaceae bacterium]